MTARRTAGFADIKYIVLTHHHLDHSGGLAAIMERSPQAQILCGVADIDAVRSSTWIAPDVAHADDRVLGLDVIPTSGHTPGHLCLFDRPSSTMLLGDLAGGSNGSLERAPAQFTENAARAEATMRALAEWDCENALPSHGAPLRGGASRSLARLAAEPA